MIRGMRAWVYLGRDGGQHGIAAAHEDPITEEGDVGPGQQKPRVRNAAHHVGTDLGEDLKAHHAPIHAHLVALLHICTMPYHSPHPHHEAGTEGQLNAFYLPSRCSVPRSAPIKEEAPSSLPHHTHVFFPVGTEALHAFNIPSTKPS